MSEVKDKSCRSALYRSLILLLCVTILSAASALLFALAGCTVGPNYHRPSVQSPAEFRTLAPPTQTEPKVSSYADLPWWDVFHDAKLQELIRTALKQSYDVQLATERINAARAELAVTKSSLFPQVGAGANFNGGKDTASQSKFNFLNLTADAAFQLDLFGKLRRETEASRANLLATEDAKQTVILTLVSDVATDYYTLLQLDLQLQITQETIKSQTDSIRLTESRLKHGVATKIDVVQAQQILDTADAQVPDLERKIAQEENAIIRRIMTCECSSRTLCPTCRRRFVFQRRATKAERPHISRCLTHNVRCTPLN